jgi:hypothetical protein
VKSIGSSKKTETAIEGLAVGLVVILGIAGGPTSGSAKSHPSQHSKANPVITMRVYDYAQVEAREWMDSKAEATRVLRNAGIEALWFDCPVTGEPASDDVCRKPLEPTALILRILPQSMADRAAQGADSFGFAQQTTDGTPSYVANVFYHRVQSAAREFGVSRAVILGHALAHEVGHLLLGRDSHSPNGIMRALWTEKELLNASAGRLVFLPQQAAVMRTEVMARTKLLSPQQVAESVQRRGISPDVPDAR